MDGVFIPNFILTSGLSNLSKLVYGRLAYLARVSGVCYVSQEKLSNDLACLVSDIEDCVYELRKSKLIKVVGNRYTFIEPSFTKTCKEEAI